MTRREIAALSDSRLIAAYEKTIWDFFVEDGDCYKYAPSETLEMTQGYMREELERRLRGPVHGLESYVCDFCGNESPNLGNRYCQTTVCKRRRHRLSMNRLSLTAAIGERHDR